MEKVVVLNSGGFDSTVLLHHVVNTLEPDSEVFSLHFTHKNRNRHMETKCVKKNCDILGVHNKIIKLPKFEWTTGRFYDSSYDIKTQYLEWRNLVFLSYAISYAQSIGATKIYMALLSSANSYCDTSIEFLESINKISQITGITVLAPFLTGGKDKPDLQHLYTAYDLNPSLYFSCDRPILGRFRCGMCVDCQDVKDVELRIKGL